VPETALAARNLKKRFGALWAVAGVSLEVTPGELHAVIGPNGAGKSTLINLLSGDLSATAGQVLIGGLDVTGLSPDRRGLAGVGRSYQKTTIFPKSSVLENVRIAAQAHSQAPLRMWTSAHTNKAVKDEAMQALATAGLEGRAAMPAGLLSHGEQRALEIAMVLATRPSIMLLDEPLAGMGPVESRAMVALVASLKHGRGILLVEHDMDAVFSLADKLTVMADGHVIASGTPLDVRAHPAVRAAYLGYEETAPT
jgi:branched-chain amino acid transport system ATP-binding protein